MTPRRFSTLQNIPMMQRRPPEVSSSQGVELPPYPRPLLLSQQPLAHSPRSTRRPPRLASLPQGPASAAALTSCPPVTLTNSATMGYLSDSPIQTDCPSNFSSVAVGSRPARATSSFLKLCNEKHEERAQPKPDTTIAPQLRHLVLRAHCPTPCRERGIRYLQQKKVKEVIVQ